MTKIVALVGVLFLVIGALTVTMAPDLLSLMIVGVMLAAICLGFAFGMVPTALFAVGFRRGRASVEEIADTKSSTPWLAAQQKESFFRQRTLDKLYAAYVTRARQQSEEGLAPGDIEAVINDESLALRSWQSAMLQIPGTLTALGLLGTFVGLVVGISNIGFTSIEAALNSIEVLLAGIETAFFTSIVGVVLSILFNVIYKLMWNVMLREMGLFIELFHLHILPSLEEQNRLQWSRDMRQIIERLDRLPKTPDRVLPGGVAQAMDFGDERRMMPEIISGLAQGEFVFYVQPRCDLSSRKIVGGEALVRWEHKTLGTLMPEAFIGIVESNGFIVRIDAFIWESVCRTLRAWLDAGQKPTPIAINISKTDIMAMDVAGMLGELIRRYRIPPRYLDIEIAESTYVQIESAARALEARLRQDGFRVLVDAFQGEVAAMDVLSRCEPDAVKLDLRFVSGKSPDAIRSLFEQARRLNCTIIAAGVETTEQLTALRRLGCKAGQGYYFFEPMPVRVYEEKMGLE